jgi:hypothetical protein
MSDKRKKPEKVIYRADYGDATPEQVARAMLLYRPGEPVRHDAKASGASPRRQP